MTTASQLMHSAWIVSLTIVILVSLFAIAVFRAFTKPNKKPNVVSLSSSSATKKRITYSNGDSITAYDAWRGNIPHGSVFSPSNPEWYFDISGLDSNRKLIFSTSWHVNMVMNQKIPKFEDIKHWQITLATNIGSSPPEDAYKRLSLE